MYLLSYEDSAEFRKSFQKYLLNPRPSHLYGADSEAMNRKFRELNRGDLSSRELDQRTRDVLAILFGLDSRSAIQPGQISQRNMIQAMVLSELNFGLFDPISVDASQTTISSFVEGEKYSFSGKTRSVQHHSVGTKFEGLSWSELFEGPLKDYLLPGDGATSTSGVWRPDVQLVLTTPKEKIRLSFELSTISAEFRWFVRGLSEMKKSHSRLVDGLNSVLDDYRRRLSAMESYRTAELAPGLSRLQAERLQVELYSFYPSGASNHSILRGGVIFDEEYLRFKDQQRGYLQRCTECSQIVGLELVERRYGSTEEWNSPHIFRRLSVEYDTNRLLGSFHRESNCSGSKAASLRTGEESFIRR